MSLIGDSVQAFNYMKRQQGWRPAFGLAAQFIRAPFFEFHTGYVLRRSLKEPIPVPACEVSVRIRQADLEDLPLLETILPPLRVKRLAKKMQAGELCCIALKEARVVSYMLAGFASTPSTEHARLKLGPREAYLWAAYALPQYRRQGLVGAVNLSFCRLLREKGYEGTVLLVDNRNRASLGHCYKIGYHVTDRITYLRILGWAVSRLSPFEEPGRGPVAERV